MKILATFIKKYWLIILAVIISLLMFAPALNGFFTHDEFYLLKIAKVSGIKEFINFFDITHDYAGLGAYRPLTLRVFYFLSVNLFNTNPLPLRIILFITFYANVFLVGRLTMILTKNFKIMALSVFLYATSVTHFGHLYYTGTFQDLLASAFVLASVIFFIKFETIGSRKYLYLLGSFIFYILALMSKEMAIITPLVLVLVHFYLKTTKKEKIHLRKLLFSVLPFLIVLAIYLVLHFFFFGSLKGDSYIWNFSPVKAANTILWYLLWSLNLPETLVDFIGPGIHLNPNLMKFWSDQIIPIFILFIIQIVFVCYAVFKSKIINQKSSILFSALWFVITLLPVTFLPLHKFTFYLALPLFGVVFFLSNLFINLKSKTYILFCIVWVALSAYSLHLTVSTNWITQGMKTSKSVYDYFRKNYMIFENNKIVFVDRPEDETLPWSPTDTLKVVLADRNFFDVYFSDISNNIYYHGEGDIKINSRQFLGY